MPVDPTDTNSQRRLLGKDGEYLANFNSLRKNATAGGSVKLGVLPEEHTFADLFGSVLETVNKNKKGRKTRKARTTNENQSDESCKNNNTSTDDDVLEGACASNSSSVTRISKESNSAFLDLSSDRDVDGGDQVVIPPTPTSYQLWDALEQVQLSSSHGGGLGVLASQGYSLVQLEVTSHCFHNYPRLRSRHVESLVHSAVGIQPMLRLATEIGLVSLARLDTDADLWKELCNIHQREQVVTRLYHLHKKRLAAGESSQRQWFYLKHMRWLRKASKLFPTDASTLLPRVEWIRNTTLAFIGWLELSEGEDAARRFVQEHICSLFDVPGDRDRDRDRGGRCGDGEADEGDDDKNNNNNYNDDPLTARQERAAHRKSTTSNVVGAEPFEDPMVRYNATMLDHLANRRVVDAVVPDNALKEAQFVLNYSPFISRENLVMISAEGNVLGGEGGDEEDDGDGNNDESNNLQQKSKRRVVKFDIKIKATTSPILESDTFSSEFISPEEQSYDTPKALEAELVCFRKVGDDDVDGRRRNDGDEELLLGSGIGLTEQEAMQACCLDFVRRYYFTRK